MCITPIGRFQPGRTLAWYFLGLRIFKSTKNLEATRKRVVSLVKQLKNRFLLLDGDKDHHVKMHDVVRDVAIFIASKVEKLPILVQLTGGVNILIVIALGFRCFHKKN
ncbi:hypothetical protein BUALT_BualtUnG0059100 [Buddleja alternifolia]|uniref:Uncharacterized protein n=1 Tax=Buddleja alternifolia TaxID=168488 RepID=A0AAV6VZU3_9LAMI|nr:hypothetical protein BUALT_BualtUnG0059100 [Buddleja alternifolia]